MGILSESVEPKLESLITKYLYARGTNARLKFQTKDDLARRYQSVPKIVELLDINTLLPRPSFISDALNRLIAEISITDVLPGQIVPVFRSYGIMCDAITMTVERKASDNSISGVSFRLYAKKSGRERFVCFGHMGLVITSDPKHSRCWDHQQFWNNMARIWKQSESVRLSAIFRRKAIAHNLRLNSKSPVSFFKYECYVNS